MEFGIGHLNPAKPNKVLRFLVTGDWQMTDDTSESRLGDRSKINLEEEWEVAFWTSRLGLTREQLAAIVKEAGPVVFDVMKKLGS